MSNVKQVLKDLNFVIEYYELYEILLSRYPWKSPESQF